MVVVLLLILSGGHLSDRCFFLSNKNKIRVRYLWNNGSFCVRKLNFWVGISEFFLHFFA